MEFISKRDIDILKILSANSRATVTEIAKAVKCSRITVTKDIKKLESKYSLKYTLELDEVKMGATERHIIVIKFSKKPVISFLRNIFVADKCAQEVFLTDGDFDIIIYAESSDPVAYTKWETQLVSKLSEFNPVFKPSELVTSHFGYLPNDDNIINQIMDNDVDEIDKKLLIALNGNSRLGYAALSKIVGIKPGTIRYRMFLLKQKGIVRRFTIAAQTPHMDYALAYFVNYRFSKSLLEKGKIINSTYFDADSSETPFNAFQLLAPLSGSYRFFVLALFRDEAEALEKTINTHVKILRSDITEIKWARITGVIKGIFQFRNLDLRANYNDIYN